MPRIEQEEKTDVLSYPADATLNQASGTPLLADVQPSSLFVSGSFSSATLLSSGMCSGVDAVTTILKPRTEDLTCNRQLVDVLSVLFPQAARSASSRQRHLISAEGGYLSASETARRLNLSETELEQSSAAGSIIGIRTSDGIVYPGWQIANGNLLEGLTRVLEILRRFDPWMQLSFMLGNDLALGVSPLTALRQRRFDEVEQVARNYGEQGAV